LAGSYLGGGFPGTSKGRLDGRSELKLNVVQKSERVVPGSGSFVHKLDSGLSVVEKGGVEDARFT
jgi:hypothetical protein